MNIDCFSLTSLWWCCCCHSHSHCLNSLLPLGTAAEPLVQLFVISWRDVPAEGFECAVSG